MKAINYSLLLLLFACEQLPAPILHIGHDPFTHYTVAKQQEKTVKPTAKPTETIKPPTQTIVRPSVPIVDVVEVTSPNTSNSSLDEVAMITNDGRKSVLAMPVSTGNIIKKIHTEYSSKKPEDGIYIHADKAGGAVRAAEDGEVVFIGDSLNNYGNLIIIKHRNKLMTAYAHLKKIIVTNGQKVKRGQIIGILGLKSNKPILHFAVRKNKKAVNPLQYLPK